MTLVVLAFATTHTDVTYLGAGEGDDTLTLTATGEGYTIGANAGVTVVDASGNPVSPQPMLHIDPNLGKEAEIGTIAIRQPGSFPVGGGVIIEKLDSTESPGGTPPTGMFGNFH